MLPAKNKKKTTKKQQKKPTKLELECPIGPNPNSLFSRWRRRRRRKRSMPSCSRWRSAIPQSRISTKRQKVTPAALPRPSWWRPTDMETFHTELIYKASSPDEEALCRAAKDNGVVFSSRSNQGITIQVEGRRATRPLPAELTTTTNLG